MRFVTDKTHRTFFYQNGWISFEHLFLDDQINNLAKQISLTISQEKLLNTPEEKFLQGRDLWRRSPSIQQFLTHPQIPKIIAELTDSPTIRLGYDQFLPSISPHPLPIDTNPLPYKGWNSDKRTLKDLSPIQPLLGGVFIPLGDRSINPEHLQTKCHLPSQRGEILCVGPETPIPWEEMIRGDDLSWYLVVYTGATAQYILNPLDIHRHALKHLGYSIQGRLTDKLHPIVWRQ